MNIMETIAQIDDMRRDITKGEWESCATRTDGGPILQAVCAGDEMVCQAPGNAVQNSIDMDYITALHNAWPTVSTELKRLQAENERLEQRFSNINERLIASLNIRGKLDAELTAKEAAIEKAREALDLLFGKNALHNVCHHEGADAFGRVMGTWSIKAENKGREALATLDGLASDAGDRWLPIEMAPKDGSEFVAANARQGFTKQLVSWNRIHGFWQSKGEFIHMQHTHWFPLPAAPKGGE